MDPAPPEIGAAVQDTHVHAVAYGFQAAILYWVLSRAMLPLLALAAGWIGAGALGVLTETLQLLVVARSSETVDVVADLFGASVVVVGVLVARQVVGVLCRLGGGRGRADSR